MVLVVLTELVALLVLVWTSVGLHGLSNAGEILAPWVSTSLGVGLLGVWLRQLRLGSTGPRPEESYESARRLLSQLRTVARRLSSGLDTVSMSSQMLVTVHQHINDSHSALFIRTEGGVLAPLAYRGTDARAVLQPQGGVVDQCWSDMAPAHELRTSGLANRRHRLALPLRTGSRMIGLVLADSPDEPTARTLGTLMRELDEQSIRLDTALAFDEVRTIATMEERRRLAREIHDGVAQEIASLGYVVDDLTATAITESHRRKLRALRAELSRLVTELRLSIFDLRSEVNPSAGLGSALSDYVREVGARSGMTVHLTLDEAPTRLHIEVESELLRIAQEAITNARKHSSADNLWVDCRIRPPFAQISVRDDGTGLGKGGSDSYGMRIMRERAERINAGLKIANQNGPSHPLGTLVTVTVGGDSAEFL
jgi:signal transduction histidine kinase